MPGLDLLVRRDDLREVRFEEAPGADAELSSGEIFLSIDKFGFSANNVTYAVLGEAMGYWEFFPGPEGWGRIPVWGYADVVASEHDDIGAGERIFGYLPMSSHLVVRPEDVSVSGFVRAPKLEHLASVYQRNLRVDEDPLYRSDREDLDALWRPLFMTSFGAADFLIENDVFRAHSIVFSSASSKTALGTAFLLSRADPRPAELIALTSPGNAAFCERLGYYDRVLHYDDLSSLDKANDAVFVDVGGSERVRKQLRNHLGAALKQTVIVGAAQWEELDPSGGLNDSDSQFFFLPNWIDKRRDDWGKGGFAARYATAWDLFAPSVDDWMKIVYAYGPDAVAEVYRELLDGKTSPDIGHVLSLTAR